MLSKIIGLALTAILIENFVLVKFLGICPFLGVSRQKGTTFGMSAAVTLVMTVTSVIIWPLYKFVLVPLKLEYLKLIAFIIVIATLVQVLEIVLNKFMPKLYKALGIYLPLITTNCAILGVALIITEKDLSFFQSVIFSFSSAIGFSLALILFSSVLNRLEFCDVPKPFKGFPIALVSAGLLALAFMGFSGLKLPF